MGEIIDMSAKKKIEVGQIVCLNGKPIGEIVESPSKGRFMVKPYNSEWKTDLGFFMCMHEDEMEIRERNENEEVIE